MSDSGVKRFMEQLMGTTSEEERFLLGGLEADVTNTAMIVDITGTLQIFLL